MACVRARSGLSLARRRARGRALAVAQRERDLPAPMMKDSMFVEPIRTMAEWPASLRRIEEFWACEVPHRFRGPEKSFVVNGYCPRCGWGNLHVTDDWAHHNADGSRTACWRETAICRCGMNTRMRSMLDWMVTREKIAANRGVYCTEATTPFFRALLAKHPFAIGSEFVSRIAPGSADDHGLRCEDLERLSFPDACFDAVVSLDVLEHVFSFRAALSEMHRVLAPGGVCLITVPFLFDAAVTVRRAALDGGKLTHLLPPVYHGDPMSKDGALLVFDYGWDLIATMKDIGWVDPTFYYFLSDEKKYLGTNYLLRATRA
ncbi:MAG: class I SAM-dependent methyltransferase [Deltaproteobacteria bacterium]|nr:class I SAM-dependent methyltransferase [Deltaproteobacteria bacterium]